MTKTFRRVQAWYRSRRRPVKRPHQELRSERSRLIGFIRFYSARIRDLVEVVGTKLRSAAQGRTARVAVFAVLMLAGIVIWQTGATPGEHNLLLFARSGSGEAPPGQAINQAGSLPPPTGPSGLVGRSTQWMEERFALIPPSETGPQTAEAIRPLEPPSALREVPPAPPERALPAVVDLSDIIWPTVGSVARGYGWLRDATTGDWRFHADLLIAPSSRGATVRPSLPGIVEEIAATGGGYAVRVRHTDSWTSEYRGLTAVTVAPGEWVSPESVLGHLAGGGDGGLRFGMRRGGEPVDPADYLYMPVSAE